MKPNCHDSNPIIQVRLVGSRFHFWENNVDLVNTKSGVKITRYNTVIPYSQCGDFPLSTIVKRFGLSNAERSFLI